MIELKSVGMKYDTRSLRFGSDANEAVLDDVSFSIDRGERIGLFGLNGSGKTTLIKLVLGIIKPTSGQILFDGHSSIRYPNVIKKRLGVIFAQKSQLWWNIPVIDSLEIISTMYGMGKQLFRQQLSLLQNDLEIKALVNKAPRFLSFGQRIRCELAATLIIYPDYLFLDEPFIGLDTAFKQKLFFYLKQYSLNHNIAIMVASHDLEHMESLVERALVLDRSLIILDTSIEELRRSSCETRINLTFPQSSESESIIRLNSLNAIFPEAYWDSEEGDPHRISLYFPTIDSNHVDFIYNFLKDNFHYLSIEFKDVMTINDILKNLRFSKTEYQTNLFKTILDNIEKADKPVQKMLELAQLRKLSSPQQINQDIVPELIDLFEREDIKVKTFIISVIASFYSKLELENRLKVLELLLRAIEVSDNRLKAAVVEAAGHCMIHSAQGSATKQLVRDIMAIFEDKLYVFLSASDYRLRANAYIALMKVKKMQPYLELFDKLLNDHELRKTYFYIFEVLTLHYPFADNKDLDDHFKTTLIRSIQNLINMWIEKKCFLSSITVNRLLTFFRTE